MPTKFPEQIVPNTYGGLGTSIDVQDKLVSISETSDTPPLQVHEGRLSRYVVTIKNPDKEFVSTSIPAEDVRALAADIEVLNAELLRYEADDELSASSAKVATSPESSAPTSISASAPNVTLQFGKFAGKTPLQVLAEDPANKEQLLWTKSLLEKNLEKFPKNKTTIDSINYAISLLESGSINSADTSANDASNSGGKKCIVYNQPIHTGRSASSGDGFYTVTGIKITCFFGRKYPWQVEISSCEAPVTKGAKGDMQVEFSKRRNSKCLKINLSRHDWHKISLFMEANLDRFENANYPTLYERSRKILKSNIETYRSSSKS